MCCYRDMTFCSFYEDCAHGKECPRALTPEVDAKAKAWWGIDGEAPICQFVNQPECFHAKK